MEPTISVATVLLPLSSTRVSFKITASLGCFAWTITSDVVSVTPLFEDPNNACKDPEASPFDGARKDESCSTGLERGTKKKKKKKKKKFKVGVLCKVWW